MYQSTDNYAVAEGLKGSEAKPGVFTLEGLIAWLEMQPGETEYPWWSASDCLLTRYLKLHGYSHERGDLGKAYCMLSNAVGGHVAFTTPWTYSSALSRAKALHLKGGE